MITVKAVSVDTGKVVGKDSFELEHKAQQQADFYNYQTDTLNAEIQGDDQ